MIRDGLADLLPERGLGSRLPIGIARRQRMARKDDQASVGERDGQHCTTLYSKRRSFGRFILLESSAGHGFAWFLIESGSSATVLS